MFLGWLYDYVCDSGHCAIKVFHNNVDVKTLVDGKNPPPPDWHELAKKASEETDPKKLMQIVKELISALGEHEKREKL
jgi:hypothetical protein